MPSVTNPTDVTLICLPLGRNIGPRQTVTCTREQAEAVSQIVFIVDDGVPALKTQETAAPTRKTATRGGRRAEVTEAPATETRAW